MPVFVQKRRQFIYKRIAIYLHLIHNIPQKIQYNKDVVRGGSIATARLMILYPNQSNTFKHKKKPNRNDLAFLFSPTSPT